MRHRSDRFGKSVDAKLAAVKQYLPEDLIIARTSDQPLQVKENISLFMDALYEAILLVVLVSWLGFWEWRSALLMAISMPVTLAMTFGAMYLLGIDIQQVSVATLIIALGLLVDDPVLAGDSIKRALAEGQPEYHSRLARAYQARHGNHVCDGYEHRRLSALPDGHRQHGRIPLQPAHRHDLFPGRFAAGLDDLSSVSRLLSSAPGEKAGKDDRANAQRRLLRMVCADRTVLDRASLEVLHRLSGLSGLRRLHLHATEFRLFPRGRSVLVVHRCLAAQ